METPSTVSVVKTNGNGSGGGSTSSRGRSPSSSVGSDPPRDRQDHPPIPPCLSTTSTLTSSSPPHGHSHHGKTVTFELDDDDREHLKPPAASSSRGSARRHTADDIPVEVEGDEPLCGTTVAFEVDHADNEVLYIPHRPEDSLLPVMKLVVRTILEDRHAKLNRNTLYDTVQRYAQAKVEIQRLRHQLGELQARYDQVLFLPSQQPKPSSRGAGGGSRRGLLSRRDRAEAALRERLRFWGKPNSKNKNPVEEITAVVVPAATTNAAYEDDGLRHRRRRLKHPFEDHSESHRPLSRVDVLRNRRRYLESLTQDLLSVEISTASATGQASAALRTKQGATAEIGGKPSKDESLSTCSSSSSEQEVPNNDVSALVRIIGTRLEV